MAESRLKVPVIFEFIKASGEVIELSTWVSAAKLTIDLGLCLDKTSLSNVLSLMSPLTKK